jgi:hypothetical protein
MKLEGFLEKIEEDIAIVVIKTGEGDDIEATLPASWFAECKERRRFFCHLEIEPIPDIEITPEREKEITEQIEKALGDEE